MSPQFAVLYFLHKRKASPDPHFRRGYFSALAISAQDNAREIAVSESYTFQILIKLHPLQICSYILSGRGDIAAIDVKNFRRELCPGGFFYFLDALTYPATTVGYHGNDTFSMQVIMLQKTAIGKVCHQRGYTTKTTS